MAAALALAAAAALISVGRVCVATTYYTRSNTRTHKDAIKYVCVCVYVCDITAVGTSNGTDRTDRHGRPTRRPAKGGVRVGATYRGTYHPFAWVRVCVRARARAGVRRVCGGCMASVRRVCGCMCVCVFVCGSAGRRRGSLAISLLDEHRRLRQRIGTVGNAHHGRTVARAHRAHPKALHARDGAKNKDHQPPSLSRRLVVCEPPPPPLLVVVRRGRRPLVHCRRRRLLARSRCSDLRLGNIPIRVLLKSRSSLVLPHSSLRLLTVPSDRRKYAPRQIRVQ